MLRRIATVAVVVLLATALSFAGDHAAATKPTGKCMMWTATSKTATVYLVGSLHEDRPGLYPVPKQMGDAFDKADLLVEEVKDANGAMKLFDEASEKAKYTGHETLADHLTAEQWKDVKAACERVDLPTETAEKMRPQLLNLYLQGYAEAKARREGGRKVGVVRPPGLDDYFADAADKRNMPVDGFETAESHLDRYFGTLDKPAVQDLMDEVSQITGAQAKTDGTDGNFAVWSTGDTAVAGEAVAKLAERQPGWARRNIFDRNSRMADKIEQYLEGKKVVFVVVGWTHTVGERGIVQMLRDDGFAVEQSSATRAE